jgi:hypothetical protein
VEGRLADVQLAGPGLAAPRLELVSGSAILQLAGAERSWVLTAERGQLSFPDATTRFDLRAVSVAGTRLEGVSGVWDPSAPGYGVTATGLAPAVRLADLQLFMASARLPAEGTARFEFSIEPAAEDGTAFRISDLALVSGGSRVTGSLAAEAMPGGLSVERVDLMLQDVAVSLVESFAGPLPYRGTVTGTVRGPGSDIRLDLTASLSADGAAERFGVAVNGAVSLTRAGLTLRDVRAEVKQAPLSALRPLIPGLPLAGQVTGTVRLSGSPSDTPLEVDARIELGTGLATLAGTLDLTGAVPGYDVTGRLIGVNLQSVLAPAVPPVALTAQFALEGSGVDPAEARATVRLDGSFGGWRAAPGDTIALSAALAAGSVQVSSLAMRLANAEVGAEGSWRFVEPVAGAVRYRLAVADLAPFGPYLPAFGDSTAAGSLTAEGTVSGLLASMQFGGEVKGSGLRVGRWAAGQLEARYALAPTGGAPNAEIQLEAEDIATAGAGAYDALTVDLRLLSSQLKLEVRGTLAGGGEVAVVAEGSVPREGARSVLVQRGWFDLPEGRWELQSPARIVWGGDDGVRVSNARLRNARTTGEVSVEGRVLPLDRLDGRLVVADLPLDQVQDLLGRERLVTGRLWADLMLRQPGSGSEIQGTFRLDQGVIEGVALSRLDGRIDYAAGVARTEFTATFDSAAGRLDLRGTLPLRIVLGDSVEFGLAEAGPLDATLTAERVSLEPFALLLPRVRNLAGQIDGTLTLQGTVADPRLTGQLSLSGGRMSVPQLNQRFESMGGTIAFSGRTAELRDLRIRRDGWARVNGTIVFEELDRPVLQLAAELDGFRPIGVDEHPDAAFSGRITAEGELGSLVVTGRVLINDGYLAVPQLGVGYYPEYLEGIDPAPVLGRDFGARAGGSWAANARIDGLLATFGEGAWVEAFDATLQLRGDLTIDRAGDELLLTGTLQGERGTYTLSAGPIVRRFEIIRSQVRFLGSPELNPAIDITARRIVLDPDGRRMEVEVQITGTARAPRLALASAEAPDIPESELLSFLLFGRRTLALGESVATTGGAVFEQTFFGGFAEVAGLELERALASNLGLQLDLFQVRFGQGYGGLTTPTFVLGRQISNDFFLTVESGLNALLGDAGAAASTWAVRLEWAIGPRQALELGSEPLNRARLLRGIGAALPPGRPSPQQLYAEYRRRWVY